MRVKTDDRRRAFLHAAMKVFQDVGYERASMTAIAAEEGGSKATLYNYFSSKEELYAEAMTAACEDQGQELIDLFRAPASNTRAMLTRFGEAYVKFVSSDEIVALTRTAMTEVGNAGLGRALYASGSKRFWDRVEMELTRLIEAGELRSADTKFMTAHLQGLLEARVTEPLFYNAVPAFEPSLSAKAAIDAFMRIYGTQESPI